MAPKIDLDSHVKGVLDGKRAHIARAITLVESTRPDHRALAQQLLRELLPHSGSARRIGISGVPGVGKSTFIDALGTMLTGLGHRVAVLAVDPSSSRTGGSILGDKTRMERLAVDPAAFVRPSPTAGTLGGVAKAARESIVADGPHERDARSAARELAGALRLMHPVDAAWTPPVLTCSARESSGLHKDRDVVREDEGAVAS
ncbi:hypothetical protein [Streptomyces sp. NPDC094144]|uniref:hypothetical protein n=1 Tax=Streptomyces sp. NPDC094144 TaxID=3366056 RepID=UPI0037F35D61